MNVQTNMQGTLRVAKRPADERGKADYGWLQTSHSFSFGEYYDPNFSGFGKLIVLNDDLVDAGKGVGRHPHRNVEIFSYILRGALEHKDSMGNGSVVSGGGVQYMSAGSGVTHSEFNPSLIDDTRFLQVWLLPEVENTEPAYDTIELTPEDKTGKLKLFLSKDGRDGSIRTQADASVYATILKDDQVLTYDLSTGRKGWVQVADGSIRVHDVILNKGDGLAIEGSGTLVFDQGKDAEFLFFDMAS